MIGIKFLLKGGLFFAALMPEANAREYIRNWSAGYLKGKVIVAQDGTWAVAVDDIACMHLIDPKTMQQVQPNTMPPGIWKSGNN